MESTARKHGLARITGRVVSLGLAASIGVPASAQPLFPGQNFPAGGTPRVVVVADLDGDAVLDLVATNYHARTMSVLLGNGDWASTKLRYEVAAFAKSPFLEWINPMI